MATTTLPSLGQLGTHLLRELKRPETDEFETARSIILQMADKGQWVELNSTIVHPCTQTRGDQARVLAEELAIQIPLSFQGGPADTAMWLYAVPFIALKAGPPEVLMNVISELNKDISSLSSGQLTTAVRPVIWAGIFPFKEKRATLQALMGHQPSLARAFDQMCHVLDSTCSQVIWEQSISLYWLLGHSRRQFGKAHPDDVPGFGDEPWAAHLTERTAKAAEQLTADWGDLVYSLPLDVITRSQAQCHRNHWLMRAGLLLKHGKRKQNEALTPVLQPIVIDKPSQHIVVSTAIFDEDESYRIGSETVLAATSGFSVSDQLTTLENVNRAVFDRCVVRASEHRLSLDAIGRGMVRNARGELVDADHSLAGPGYRWVKRLSWRVPSEHVQRDPNLVDLPYPHRMLRRGIERYMEEHYTNDAFEAIRRNLSDGEVCLDDACKKIYADLPDFKSLEERAPEGAFPSRGWLQSVQHLWTGAPTLVATEGLMQRLAYTDLDLELPAFYLRTPYQLAYLHFEALSSVDFNHENLRYRMEGCFVHETSPAQTSLRQLSLVFVCRDDTSPDELLIKTIFTINNNKEELLSDVVARTQAELSAEDEDASSSMSFAIRALPEIAKVLVYLGCKSARIVERTERTRAISPATMKGRSPSQKSAILKAAKKLYDFIEVGPEEPFIVPASTEHSGRVMPVHPRRGHMHTVRFGPKWSESRQDYREPVLVNADRLGKDEPSPRPKDYRVR